jgi:hypothetical protein
MLELSHTHLREMESTVQLSRILFIVFLFQLFITFAERAYEIV